MLSLEVRVVDTSGMRREPLTPGHTIMVVETSEELWHYPIIWGAWGESQWECNQRKMVPSDPLVNSFSSRHARLEHGIRKRRDVKPLNSPRLVLSSLGSVRWCASAVPFR
jgi:hypothetical protein